MAPHFFLFAALAQLIFIQCQVFQHNKFDEIPETTFRPIWREEDYSNETESKDVSDYTPESTAMPPICDEDVVSDYHEAQKDMFDLFFGSFQPCSATKVLSDITCSEHSEEKVQQIKDAIDRITSATKMELYNVLESAISVVNNAGSRKKRSLETPMDSAKLVTRLLKHIRANNDHLNIAIDKMMTGQEIADKYGIEFNPEPEILWDLAAATTDQLSKLVDNEDIDYIDYVPFSGENEIKNNTYYQYQIQQQEKSTVSQQEQNNTADINVNIDAPKVDVEQQQVDTPQVDVTQVDVPHYHYWQPDYESQIVAPAVSERPNLFYDTPAFTPVPEFYTAFAPVLEETTIYIAPESQEPELVGEEYEETMTSKVLVEQGEEPGSATMNHVTTYTVSEKAHFKAPEVASLPQQVQYYFYLM